MEPLIAYLDVVFFEVALLALIPLMAVLMARGIGR
jgi:uncharacterized membrane protein